MNPKLTFPGVNALKNTEKSNLSFCANNNNKTVKLGIIKIIILIIIHLYSAFCTRFKGAVYKNQIELKSKNNHKKLTLKLDANYKIDK